MRRNNGTSNSALLLPKLAELNRDIRSFVLNGGDITTNQISMDESGGRNTSLENEERKKKVQEKEDSDSVKTRLANADNVSNPYSNANFSALQSRKARDNINIKIEGDSPHTTGRDLKKNTSAEPVSKAESM